MKNRWIWTVIGILLLAMVSAAFVWPHEMVSPGNLQPAHAALEDDCFACHVVFKGASPERCTSCHKIADIGLRTTRGTPASRARPIMPFHQALTDKRNCLACHSDHPAPRLSGENQKTFDHALLVPTMRGQCQTCHRAPQDMQHRGVSSNCAVCHQPARWKPSTFDHSRYFLLEGSHRVACATCHLDRNYQRYTCYSCHEHDPVRIKAAHIEEGIRKLDDCVRCHRSDRVNGEREKNREEQGDE